MSAYAHVVFAVVAREFLRAFKRFKNVWSAFSRTQARNVHVCSCLSQSSCQGALDHLILKLTPLYYQHKIKFLKKQESSIHHELTAPTEAFLCLKAFFIFFCLDWIGIMSLPLKCCHWQWKKYEVLIIGDSLKNRISFFICTEIINSHWRIIKLTDIQN